MFAERFASEAVLARLRDISARARVSLEQVKPGDDDLVGLVSEVNGEGVVTKCSLGIFDLPWQAAEHPEWAAQVKAETEAIRARLEEAQGVPLRFIIWAGMGGSIEDKTLYNAAHLLRGGPRLYSLDSTDPGKLKAIVEDMQRRSGETLGVLLKSTLVVGMAMGMTSYEPVVNLERLAELFERNDVDAKPNFIYMTLPDSLLDRFAGPRGFERIALQPDGANSTAGRHSAPMTRGSLYPLAFARVDLEEWIAGAQLTDEEIAEAWKLAAFLHAQGLEGRDKVSLLLPESWAAAGLWTKQDVEESLGKSEELGIKIVIDEKVRLRSFRRIDDQRQDRVFLVFQRKGEAHPEAKQITALRHAGYAVAIVTFAAAKPLSHYMQFIHYVVGGLGYLRCMNFVTQPSVELYKSIASELYKGSREAGGTANLQQWRELRMPHPRELANKLKKQDFEYGELTWFGDLRYSEEGRAMRVALERVADRVFRSRLKMPVDIYEGPAMNHSYHEMVIGHGRCFSIVMTAAQQTRFPAAHYEPDYHMAQFLATKLALEERGREVIAFAVEETGTFEAYFQEVASFL
jgi:glucose-6-phosphate isomerase